MGVAFSFVSISNELNRCCKDFVFYFSFFFHAVDGCNFLQKYCGSLPLAGPKCSAGRGSEREEPRMVVF